MSSSLSRRVCIALFVLALGLVAVSSAGAQTLGTFTWQMQPYCNVLTLSVTRAGSAYSLDGFEESCEQGIRSAASGVAFPRPDGSIALGISIITADSGNAVHVDATISLTTLSGTWRDSNFQTGIFAFGASGPGDSRPHSARAVLAWSALDPAIVLGVGIGGTRAAPLPPEAGQQLTLLGGGSYRGPGLLFTPAYMSVTATENWSPNALGGKLELFTTANGTSNATTRMTVMHNRFVGIGTTTPQDQLQVIGDIRIGTQLLGGCLRSFAGSPIIGTCSSDTRFKRDVAPFAHTLDRIAQLRPVHYYWRAAEFPGKHFGPDRAYGLIAQDVAEVMPELVSTDADGYQVVDYKLPLLAIQAIKDLKERNDALRQQLEAQHGEILRRLATLETNLPVIPR